jgi:glycopeptide antibiotics resistance protein
MALTSFRYSKIAGGSGRVRYFRVSLSAALIMLGTFPWDLQDHAHWNRVAWLPFATGIVRPLDLLVNLLIYLPLGYTLQAARGPGDLRARVGATAFALSLLLEISQVWSHVRFPSATDVVMNVVGAVAGASMWLARAARPVREGGSRPPAA